MLVMLGATSLARAEETWQPIPRTIPPAGIEIGVADREALQKELNDLQCRMLSFSRIKARHAVRDDIEIYLKAVRFALEESEFYRPQDLETARELLRDRKSVV